MCRDVDAGKLQIDEIGRGEGLGQCAHAAGGECLIGTQVEALQGPRHASRLDGRCDRLGAALTHAAAAEAQVAQRAAQGDGARGGLARAVASAGEVERERFEAVGLINQAR